MISYLLRPSAAHRWTKCHGYLAMARQFPEMPGSIDTTAREVGVATHWAIARLAEEDWVPEGDIAPNGVVITEEMLDQANMFLAEVKSWGAPAQHELTLPARRIHPQCGGTSDAWAYREDTRTLYIGDHKGGFRYVDVFENLQLIIYYTSIVDYLGLRDEGLTVVFVIVQPNTFGSMGDQVRYWKVKAFELRGIVNLIEAAAYAAVEPDAPLKTGPHCVDCSACLACPALQKAAGGALDVISHSIPHVLDAAAVSTALTVLGDAFDLVDAMLSGLKMQADHMMRSGHLVPGYSLEPTAGRLTWHAGKEDEVKALAAALGVVVTKPEKLLTPTQSIDLLGAKLVNEYASRPSAGLKLKRLRENTLRKIFEGT